jgi:hypothetical protein
MNFRKRFSLFNQEDICPGCEMLPAEESSFVVLITEVIVVSRNVHLHQISTLWSLRQDLSYGLTVLESRLKQWSA